ncbi:hypothetical protein HPB51_011837 [Rhipicephalus microplus]|uniref:SGNH hydrolase-type esterase domain-containing protein n=1 Tax=Rhipicephalus microplus TaxID=6941 RepID=A0A9J6EGG9_RHIMP|nr:hypothetical protein HPB51_011837 [Rhipicephalus microplus]
MVSALTASSSEIFSAFLSAFSATNAIPDAAASHDLEASPAEQRSELRGALMQLSDEWIVLGNHIAYALELRSRTLWSTMQVDAAQQTVPLAAATCPGPVHRPHSPAFICQPGACIGDIGELLDFVPKGTSNLILHIGTNDLANTDAPTAFNRYVALLDRIRHERPDIPMVFATLVLPRAPNQRLRRHNWRAVRRFNFEAREFNLRLLSLCHEREGVFYVNHPIDALPPWTILMADGLHPSFTGVSLLAWNIYNLLLDLRRPYINNWLEHAPQPEAGAHERRETPSYSLALRRDSSDATCRGGKEKKMNQAAPETAAAHSTGQHTPSGPPSPSAQPLSRLPRLSSTPTRHTPGNGDEG